ncbi:MAG: 4-hydroxyphenylpyruvate dioxygenase, partial [Synechococcales cyanobacterium RM1_1_8]|nr:4-hydroxyphenylpyruvate dioxygenase [Synechococcales cyanobacterium RM1_1_8]
TGPDPDALASYFDQMGFTAVGRHRSKDVVHYVQGDINFLLNREKGGQPHAFRNQHGAGANAMAFRVKDAAFAYREAIRRGAGVWAKAGEPQLAEFQPVER